ncbi:MAG: phytoene/squalene synthase family protein [Gammaproteobacteria bacterium]|nr:MAG: phytoene/squalene synthase family protein [Gammaproteobacteria bacterium]
MNGQSQYAADLAYQERALQGVSRTFALTIPTLPDPLERVVGNAYLLCRLADTVEDEPAIDPARKRELSEQFIAVVRGDVEPAAFSEACLPLLSDSTSPDEQELVRRTDAVIRITHSFTVSQRRALERCVAIMARGMSDYQECETLEGLPDLPAMDRYCYFVAGVVGEMLTELFCDHDEAIARHRKELMPLAVSFGQGLQMTNILKDIWDDRRRGACWLPQDVFRMHGFSLGRLRPGCDDPRFLAGMGELIGIARHHLEEALEYTLLIPAHQAGIRRFCLWALGMAVLTLRRINGRRDFSDAGQVKISRRSVRTTVAVTSALARYDGALRLLFATACRGLPRSGIREKLCAGRERSV